MKLIDQYDEKKRAHKEMLNVLSSIKKKGNRLIIAGIISNHSHNIEFMFKEMKDGLYAFKTSQRLSEYITEACEVLQKDILAKALELSKADLFKSKVLAKDEANQIFCD